MPGLNAAGRTAQYSRTVDRVSLLLPPRRHGCRHPRPAWHHPHSRLHRHSPLSFIPSAMLWELGSSLRSRGLTRAAQRAAIECAGQEPCHRPHPVDSVTVLCTALIPISASETCGSDKKAMERASEIARGTRCQPEASARNSLTDRYLSVEEF
jgi:hypothetical protein